MKAYLRYVPTTTFGVVASPQCTDVLVDASGKRVTTACLEEACTFDLRQGAKVSERWHRERRDQANTEQYRWCWFSSSGLPINFPKLTRTRTRTRTRAQVLTMRAPGPTLDDPEADVSHVGEVTSLASSPDGKTVAAGYVSGG